MKNYTCKTCGGALINENGAWICKHCGNVYAEENVKKEAEMLRALLDEAKQEQIANLRRNLYNAINANYINSDEICRFCERIKELLPDDFMASFYDTANKGTPREICAAIRGIDEKEHAVYVEGIVRHMVTSMRSEYALPLQNLVERAYKSTDIHKFWELSTAISEEIAKVNTGIYETSAPRDVFVAYSSKDMKAVEELVEYLEDNSLDCFVAARNLRHGRGSVQNYELAIHEAMDNCKWIVFVSSKNSRSMECDALKVELKYAKNCDVQNAPPEYKKNYSDIPSEYKKNRIEYRIDNESSQPIAEKVLKEFFSGLEYALSREDVLNRIYGVSDKPDSESEPIIEIPSEEPIEEPVEDTVEDTIEDIIEDPSEVVAEPTEELIEEDKDFSLVYDYFVNADTTTCTIVKLKDKEAEDIQIPSRIEGKRVTVIGEKAFSFSQKLLSVTIPSGVTKIGENAFSHCSKLMNVTIPNSVKSIGDWAFIGCKSIESMLIPSSVKRIGSNAFEECTSLTDINIPNGVTNIGAWAFSKCASLASITIPNGVSVIGECAFSNCSKLSLINIPESVASIAGSAFSGCKALTNIKVSPNNKNYKDLDGNLYSKDGKTLINYSCGKKSVLYIIPDGVTNIGDDAFAEASNLTGITIPDSVTHIGAWAFCRCSNLASINIPSGVKSIGERTFYSCRELETISLSDSVTSIGAHAFENCEKLSVISIPDRVIIIEEYPVEESPVEESPVEESPVEACLEDIERFSDINIPSSVTSIGECAFKGCSGFVCIDIPYGVKSIEKETFSGCYNLKSITIPDSVTSIGEYAFYNCSDLTSINIPNNVTSIGEYAFYYCSSLTSINIPNSVTSIGKFAFYNCSKLTSVTVPECIANENFSTFFEAENIKDIIISDGVTTIGAKAFYNCSKLTSVTIPSSITSIEDRAFENCKKLSTITFEGSKKEWRAIKKGKGWKVHTGALKVTCTDGTVIENLF